MTDLTLIEHKPPVTVLLPVSACSPELQELMGQTNRSVIRLELAFDTKVSHLEAFAAAHNLQIRYQRGLVQLNPCPKPVSRLRRLRSLLTRPQAF